MNRRDFAKTMGAAAVVPMLPIMPKAAVAAAANPAPKIAPAAVFWAKFMTTRHNACTPAMLASALKVELINAEAICANLVQANFLTQQQALGAAYQSARHVVKTSAPKTGITDQVKHVKSAVEQLASIETDEATAEPDHDPLNPDFGTENPDQIVRE